MHDPRRSAASLLGAVQFGVGGLAAPVVGLLGNDAVAMATVIAIATFAALGVLHLLVRPDRLEIPDASHRATPSLNDR